MPRLTKARRQEIRTAIRANRKPTRGASNRAILATGAGPNRRQNKYVVLSDGAGKLTEAGHFYYETTGAERPRAAFNQDQQAQETTMVIFAVLVLASAMIKPSMLL